MGCSLQTPGLEQCLAHCATYLKPGLWLLIDELNVHEGLNLQWRGGGGGVFLLRTKLLPMWSAYLPWLGPLQKRFPTFLEVTITKNSPLLSVYRVPR